MTVNVAANTSDASPASAERRFPERYICSRPFDVMLIARPHLQAHRAVVHDFCRQGLGIVIDRSFEIGTLVAIELQSARAGISCVLSGTICHATQQPDGKWRLGCTLSRRLTDHEIIALL
jgi:hypothetical protein